MTQSLLREQWKKMFQQTKEVSSSRKNFSFRNIEILILKIFLESTESKDEQSPVAPQTEIVVTRPDNEPEANVIYEQ